MVVVVSIMALLVILGRLPGGAGSGFAVMSDALDRFALIRLLGEGTVSRLLFYFTVTSTGISRRGCPM